MHTHHWILLLLFAAVVDPADAQEATSLAPSYTWRVESGSVALLRDGAIVWQFHHGPQLNVPYFHPLSTPAGDVLTSNCPPDHAWHHGLWFAWKFINGVNYWEHAGTSGRTAGRTEASGVRVETRADHSAQIELQLDYRPSSGAPIVLHESRILGITPPAADGSYTIDWQSHFSAGEQSVLLDRVPPKEQSWGGYAGLSVRFALDLSDRQISTADEHVAFGEGGRYRGHSTAMDYSGTLPTSVAGLAFLDHPDNPRHPTPWYAIGSPEISYLNAAILSDEPLELAAGQKLSLKYRVIVHEGRWGPSQLQSAAEQFVHPPAATSTK